MKIEFGAEIRDLEENSAWFSQFVCTEGDSSRAEDIAKENKARNS